MRAFCAVLVLVCVCVCRGALSVQVQVGERSFPLEAVKELKELMDLNDDVNPRLADTSTTAVCSHPLLPQVFRSVCQGKGAGLIFSRLVYVTMSLDLCEVCANPSCYGCLG